MDQFPVPSIQSDARKLATLEDEITELAAHLNAATYRLLTLIREFDERHGWSGAGMKSCARWNATNSTTPCGNSPGISTAMAATYSRRA